MTNDEFEEPVAWQDTANHMEIVLAEDWENIDPMWHWMYRPLYKTPAGLLMTPEEIAEVAERMEATDAASSFWREFARAIEAAHGIGDSNV